MQFSKITLDKLKNRAATCVLTGAGISSESGVPTFRGAKGLWAKFRPEELANFDAFIKNPKLVWEWYQYRRNIISEVTPNAAHHALVDLEKRARCFTLVTQNVDNLHQRAGSRNVLELHGNIERSYCLDCKAFAAKDHNGSKCPSCGGLLRPDVVWFGEMLPEGVFEKGAQAARQCELFLCIGTSAVVYPAASLPLLAKEG